MKNFGLYLRELRKAKGMTLDELREVIGYSNPYLSQIENRENRAPSPEIIRKFSAALGVNHIEMMMAAGYVTEEELRDYTQPVLAPSEELRDTLGDYIRKLRRSRGYKSQLSLAEASGISQATISRVEDSSQYPNEQTLRVLLTLLEIPKSIRVND